MLYLRICPVAIATVTVHLYPTLPHVLLFSVVGCDESLCDPEANVQGSFPRGLLSSYVALQSDCGSSSCPWRLQALPGQKFNFTLLDFSHSVQQDQRPGSNFCHRYAIIEESNDGSKDITSCTQDRHKARERHVYESSSNSVTVTLYTPSVGEDSIHFLLRYDGEFLKLDGLQTRD